MALACWRRDLADRLGVDVKFGCIFLFLAATGCTDLVGVEVQRRVELSGEWVIDGFIPEETLAAGKRVYLRNCQTCHGEKGDGNGPSGKFLSPRPRNFQKAKFKFAGVEDRGLPHDDELVRIITGGLEGSAMRAWDLPEKQVREVIQYIKTFSEPGKGFRSPKLTVKKPKLPNVPGKERQAELIAKGAKLYHTYFECAKCHPSYVSPEKFREWETAQRVGFPYLPAPKWSPNYEAVLVPPNFLEHSLRSVGETKNGHRVEDLYRIVAYGLQGPMPGYGHLGEDDVWAVALYVKSISDMKRTEEGAALLSKMNIWASSLRSK